MPGMNIGIDIEGKSALNFLDVFEKKFKETADMAEKLGKGFQVDGVAEQLSELGKISTLCMNKVEALKKEIGKAEDNLLSASLAGDSEAIDKWADKLQTATSQLATMEGVVAKVRESIGTLQDAKNKSTIELTVTTGGTDEAYKQMQELNGELDKTGEKAKDTFKDLGQDELQQKLEDTRKEIDKIHDATGKLDVQLRELGEQRDVATASGDTEEYNRLTTEINRLTTEYKDYQRQLDELSETKRSLNGEMSERETKIQAEKDATEDLTDATKEAADAKKQLQNGEIDNSEAVEGKNIFMEYADAIKKTGRAYKLELLGSIKSANVELDESNKYYIEQKDRIEKLSIELRKLQQEQSKLKSSGAKDEAKKLNGEISSLKDKLIGARDSLRGASTDLENAKQKVKELADEYQNLKETEEATEGLFDSLKGALVQGAAMMGIGVGIKEFASQVFNVRGEFQKLEASFKNLLQSEEKATELMGQLTKTAATTPFGLQEVASSAKQLIAYGTEASRVNDIIIKLGDVAAGVGAPLKDLVYLYGTTMTQGRMFTQDLRQFMGRGIPLAEELAKQFGVTKDKVGELVTKGKVGAEEFEKALLGLASTGGHYAGLMDAQSKTLLGQYSNLEDSVQMMFNDIGKSSEGAFNLALKGANTLVENYKTVGEVLGTLVVAVGAYKAAVMVASAVQSVQNKLIAQATIEKKLAAMANVTLSDSEAMAAAKTKMFTAAQIGLKNALIATAEATLLNPYVWAAAALTALVVATYSYVTAADNATVSQEGFNNSLEKEKQFLEERKAKIEELVRVIQSADTTPLQKQLAFDQLKSIAPEFTEVYDSVDKLSKADLSNITKQTNEYLDVLQEQDINKKIELLKKYKEELYKNGNHKDVDEGMKNDFGVEFGWTKNVLDKQEIISGLITEWSNKLYELKKAKEEANTPVEVKVQAAQESFDDAKYQMDLLTEYEQSAKREIEGDPIVYPVDGSVPIRTTEEIEEELKKKIDELSHSPIELTAEKRQALNAYKSLLDQMRTWKRQAEKDGLFTFFINIKTGIQKLKDALTGQQKKADQKAKGAGYSRGDNGKYTADSKTEERTYATIEAERKKLNEELRALSTENAKGKEGQKLKNQIDALDKELEAYNTNKKNASAAKKAQQERAKRLKEQAKFNELQLKQKKENQRAQEDADFEARQATLNAEKDSREKTLKQIELTFEKETRTIVRGYEDLKEKKIAAAKALWEADPKNKKAIEKGATFDASKVDTTATAEEQAAYEANLAKAKAQHDKSLEDIYKKDLESMRSYLKEYGTYEEQKLAITQEYEEKIAKARKEGNKGLELSLTKERDNSLANINSKSLALDIDWSQTFSGVGNVLGDIARETLSKIQAYMRTDEFKKLSSDQKKPYQDFANKLQQEGAGQSTSAFNFKIWGTVAKDVEAYQKSVKALNATQEAHKSAVEDLTKAQSDLAKATTEDEKTVMQAIVDAAQDAVDVTANDLNGAENAKVEANNKLVDSTTRASNGIANFASYISEIGNGSLFGFADGISKLITSLAKGSDGIGKSLGELGGKIGGIVGAILQILDALGDAPNQFINDLLQRVADAVTAIIEELPQIIVTIVEKVGNIIMGILGGIGSWLGIDKMSDSDPELSKDIEKLTASNDALRYSIDKLSEDIQKGSVADADKIYEEQKSKIQESIRNTQEMMLRSSKAYSNGFWGTGIGGKHSSGAFIGEGMSNAEWERISKIVGRSINGASDFFNLTSKEMAEVRKNASDVYAHIKALADDGYEDAAQFMDEYTEYWEQLEKIENEKYEKLTSTSFDSVRDSFKSALMDMTKDTEDFAEDFESMMKNAVLESMISDVYAGKLQSWYKNWAEKMKNGLTPEEKEEMRQEYQLITEEAIAQRNNTFEAMGWDTSSSASQEASSKGFASMSQDTADELNGRFTALQIAGETISENVNIAIGELTKISSFGELANTQRQDIIFGINKANGFLEDMVRYNKGLREDMTTLLTKIENGLKVI